MKDLYLYHVVRTDSNHLDEYSDAVFAAHSPEDALGMNPRDGKGDGTDWGDAKNPPRLARKIGVATGDVVRGVICASFHAG